jgi:uncharacterized protein YjdB
MRELWFGLTALLVACSSPTGPAETGGPGGSARVASVAIEPAGTSLTVGNTLQLTVVLHDASGNALTNRTISFASSNASVLSVDGAGLVRALAEGKATITATSDGKSGQAVISVLVADKDSCLGCWDY